MTATTFHKMYTAFQNETCKDPTNAPYSVKSNKGKNRQGYIVMLKSKFPKFLHKAYQHATKTLGVSENTKRICDAMMSYAKKTYPTCPICSNLVLKKHHFWTFF